MEAVQTRQGLYVACIEEIAYRKGYIDRAQLIKLAKPFSKVDYGKYLLIIAEELTDVVREVAGTMQIIE